MCGSDCERDSNNGRACRMIGPNRSRQARDDETGARRNYWGCARERNRRLARSAIKKRLEDANSLTSMSAASPEEVLVDEQVLLTSSEWIDKVLWHIIKGKRSFFSLTCIQENLSHFEMPHISSHLFSSHTDELKGKAQMINWFGMDGYESFKEAIRNDVETFTFYEYAIWCRRWHVVGSLLIGAVNPCSRGAPKAMPSDLARRQYEQNSSRLLDFGATILKRLFDDCVPLSLSSHVVKTVVERRRSARIGTCPQCCHLDPLLRCESEGCSGVCELCWWKNVVERLDGLDDQLIGCPTCVEGDNYQKLSREGEDQSDKASRYEECQRKYLALPEDIKEFRASHWDSKKPAPPREDEFLVTTWSAAIVPALGPTKEIRRDRFFGRITKGHYHYIKGFLFHGIDIDMQNEYGQTALYVSAWLGHSQIVQLLLEYGADVNIVARGGSTALSAAESNGYDDIAAMLVECGASRHVCTWCDGDLTAGEPRLTTLIDLSVDHPGAGSFIIDNAVSSSTVDALTQLWQTIPIELALIKEKKGKICSDRSYFCDAEGFVRRALLRAITDAFEMQIDRERLIVLEHMRFLAYSVPGAVLLPHTDLHRVDHQTGVHSTHTFILYLTNCHFGGETSLLEHTHGPGREVVLAKIAPVRGRLLLFPHLTPHEGEEVVEVPKLLIRGEVILSFKQD